MLRGCSALSPGPNLGVIVVDVVQAQHPRTHLLQRHRGVEPHEPSGSGDEHGHRAGGERRTRLLHPGVEPARRRQAQRGLKTAREVVACPRVPRRARVSTRAHGIDTSR